MRTVFFAIVFLLLACISRAQQKVVFKKEFFIQQKDTLPYRLLYPENYRAGKKYPLVLFLHGAGARGNDNMAQLRNVPEALLDSAGRNRYPCFLLVPQCPKNDAWANFPHFPNSLKTADIPTTATRMALALLHDLSRNPDVDTNRLYITGYSMGGEGAFDIITRMPRMFAAAVPICPVADTGKARIIKAVNTWVFHGSADSVNPVIYSRLMIDALKQQGGKPVYTEYKDMGHQVWKKAYSEPELLPWMFSKVNHISNTGR